MAEGHVSDDLQMFISVVANVTKDEDFDLPSERSQRARLLAEKLLTFADKNEAPVKVFAEGLLLDIRKCCSHDKPVSWHIFRELMWEKYYKLCSSDDFVSSWMSFLECSIGMTGTPIFFQYVTRVLLERVVKSQFPLDLTQNVSTASASLDLEERNALRYCGGYLLRSLKKKVEKSAHPLKELLLLCLRDLFEGYNLSETTEDIDESGKWTMEINRGGLILIDDSMYLLLVSVEQQFRSHFTLDYAVSSKESIKDHAFQKIIQNEEVLFHWEIVSINWDLEEAEELLKLLVKHYITVRGFSFASAFVEKFKQSEKKSTQKSKGLRKTMDTSKV